MTMKKIISLLALASSAFCEDKTNFEKKMEGKFGDDASLVIFLGESWLEHSKELLKEKCVYSKKNCSFLEQTLVNGLLGNVIPSCKKTEKTKHYEEQIISLLKKALNRISDVTNSAKALQKKMIPTLLSGFRVIWLNENNEKLKALGSKQKTFLKELSQLFIDIRENKMKVVLWEPGELESYFNTASDLILLSYEKEPEDEHKKIEGCNKNQICDEIDKLAYGVDRWKFEPINNI
jgi:hypothetical protein